MNTPTCLIPAVAYDAALAFCNDLRAKEGKPPLAALPAGVPASYTRCPCADAVCGISVGTRSWGYAMRAGQTTSDWLEDPRSRTGQAPLPADVIGFVELFDNRGLRALIDAKRAYGTSILPVRDPPLPAGWDANGSPA